MYDICCIGHITADKITTPAGTHYLPGGTAWYFCKALAKMDVRYQLLTALGNPEIKYTEMLQQEGVAVTVLPSQHTVFFENIYGADLNHRTQRVLQKARQFRQADVLQLQASIYHLGPLLADDMDTGMIQTLAQKGRVSADVQGWLRRLDGTKILAADWTDKLTLLPHIHFLKVNEQELEVLTGHTNIALAAQQLLRWGVQELVVTLGSKGSEIYTSNDCYRVPAFLPGIATDATGCGDTYMAGYLYRRSKNDSPADAGAFASAMAGIKVTHAGPFTGTAADVYKAMQQPA
jgi:sugar/nucleoside kinase (ribokinase family)